MYLNYWRLKEHPFSNALDIRFLHMTPQHGEGVARLLYAVQQRKEGAVLTGGFGTGKSLVRLFFMSKLQTVGNFAVALVENPLSGSESIIRDIHAQISQKSQPPSGTGGGFRELAAVLEDRRSRGFHNLVVVEEAQLLTRFETLEQMRLLMDLADNQGRSLLTLIFVGQDDFMRVVVQSPGLMQRISTRWHLSPLSCEQVREYVDHRLGVAGGNGWVFDDSAVVALHELSGGTARVINNAADIALYLGMVENAARVDARLVERVAGDLLGNLPTQPEGGHA